MSINTIILIDKNQERKKFFIEKLRQKLSFSYTKIEALFQTIGEIVEKRSNEFTKIQYLEFLSKFLNNLSKKQQIYLIDVDELSVQNANKLKEEHDNIIIIYLERNGEEGNTIQINGNDEEEIDKLIEEIVKRKML